MTTVLRADRTEAPGASLRVRRRDIEFHDLEADRVRIEITVHNESDSPSSPTTMRVDVAPFGAFLPWRTLTERPVPPIPARGRTVVAFDATRPATTGALGSFERLPPARLLTAVAAGDDSGRGRAGLGPDLFQLLGRPGNHWVGNLNVFLGREPVERHRAPKLRVHAGRRNLALFCVGTVPDAYCYDLAGEGAAWDAQLLGAAGGHGFRPGAEIELGTWIETRPPTAVFACIQPPADAVRGALEVHVRQRSSGDCAVVEFDLDPRAAGPGCYVV